MKQVFLIASLMASQMCFAQDQMYEICPLKVGEDIPNTNVINADNDTIDLINLISEKPTVLIFYRGAWCGYCIQHLAELNDVKEDIEQAGYQIFGITVDRPEKLDESYERSKSEIEVYSDSKLETIKAFGLDWEADNELVDKYKNEYKLDLKDWSGEDHQSLPVPAIFIINENKVAFQYVNPNYRTRLKSETLLGILKSI